VAQDVAFFKVITFGTLSVMDSSESIVIHKAKKFTAQCGLTENHTNNGSFYIERKVADGKQRFVNYVSVLLDHFCSAAGHST